LKQSAIWGNNQLFGETILIFVYALPVIVNKKEIENERSEN